MKLDINWERSEKEETIVRGRVFGNHQLSVPLLTKKKTGLEWDREHDRNFKKENKNE